MHPEVSVVIPTYRRPALLEQALKSVCEAAKSAHLDGSALEIVVIDDGHCNKSEEMCEAAKNIQPHSILYMRTESGPGAGSAIARNQGILSAGGDYIFLLDDDDQFLTHRFRRSLPLLRSGRYDAVLERTLRVYADGRNVPYVTGPAEHITVDPFTYLITGAEDSHVTPGATSFSKSIFMKLGGYDEVLRMGEDGNSYSDFVLQVGWRYGRGTSDLGHDSWRQHVTSGSVKILAQHQGPAASVSKSEKDGGLEGSCPCQKVYLRKT